MRCRSFLAVAGIFVASAAMMYGLAVAAHLDRYSGIAVLILVLGVPGILVLQIADMIDQRLLAKMQFPDRSNLPRARARFKERGGGGDGPASPP